MDCQGTLGPLCRTRCPPTPACPGRQISGSDKPAGSHPATTTQTPTDRPVRYNFQQLAWRDHCAMQSSCSGVLRVMAWQRGIITNDAGLIYCAVQPRQPKRPVCDLSGPNDANVPNSPAGEYKMFRETRRSGSSRRRCAPTQRHGSISKANVFQMATACASLWMNRRQGIKLLWECALEDCESVISGF